MLATNNPGKQRELRELLVDLSGFRLVTPQDLGISLDVDEGGETYAENAALKARAFMEASGIMALADDSGLEVDSLDGAPGLHSARYSPKAGATDADRRTYLLEKLAGKPRPWMARFRATIAIAVPGEALRFTEGACEGEIIPEERGTGGFGYDPIFLVAGANQTMAELDEAEKNCISHRGVAMAAAKELLKEIAAAS
ncbi:MAG: RdgB/HAM1 family non-canonical purine NTP pyrophosphatase [Anaerolineae bacterium]|nr:RdgB/HAM1 family non-canonical purine NTP pyrophosphatase [Anaerolineae bacterium]